MLVWELVIGAVMLVFIVTLMSATYSLRTVNESLMKRVTGLENAMAAVEKSCTISSDTIAGLDQSVLPKLDALEKSINAVSKQANLSTAQLEQQRRSMQEIRQSLAYSNARSYHRPNTVGAPLA